MSVAQNVLLTDDSSHLNHKLSIILIHEKSVSCLSIMSDSVCKPDSLPKIHDSQCVNHDVKCMDSYRKPGLLDESHLYALIVHHLAP